VQRQAVRLSQLESPSHERDVEQGRESMTRETRDHRKQSDPTERSTSRG